jgi:hypothetical protein
LPPSGSQGAASAPQQQQPPSSKDKLRDKLKGLLK